MPVRREDNLLGSHPNVRLIERIMQELINLRLADRVPVRGSERL